MDQVGYQQATVPASACIFDLVAQERAAYSGRHSIGDSHWPSGVPLRKEHYPRTRGENQGPSRGSGRRSETDGEAATLRNGKASPASAFGFEAAATKSVGEAGDASEAALPDGPTNGEVGTRRKSEPLCRKLPDGWIATASAKGAPAGIPSGTFDSEEIGRHTGG